MQLMVSDMAVSQSHTIDAAGALVPRRAYYPPL